MEGNILNRSEYVSQKGCVAERSCLGSAFIACTSNVSFIMKLVYFV